MKAEALALCAVGLVGCASAPNPREVPLPVPTPCIKAEDMPRAAFLTDAQLASMSDYQLVLALRGHHIRSLAHIAALEALLLACQ